MTIIVLNYPDGGGRRYIQDPRGEFSCAKPRCIRLQNGWVTNRTLCHLAMYKPAIIQRTGLSRFLPDAVALFRFRIPEEALRHVKTVVNDYETQCGLARALAEEYFRAHNVVGWMLEHALA